MNPSPHSHQVRVWECVMALPATPPRHGTARHAVAASVTKPAPYDVHHRSLITLSHAGGTDVSIGTGLPS